MLSLGCGVRVTFQIIIFRVLRESNRPVVIPDLPSQLSVLFRAILCKKADGDADSSEEVPLCSALLVCRPAFAVRLVAAVMSRNTLAGH